MTIRAVSKCNNKLVDTVIHLVNSAGRLAGFDTGVVLSLPTLV